MDAKPLTGTFTVHHGDASVVLTLEHTPGGTVQGRLTGYGGAFDLHGLGAASGLQGSLVDNGTGQRFSFAARLQGERFHLSLFPLDPHGQIAFHAIQTLTLERQGTPPAEASPPAEAPPPAEVALPGPADLPAPPPSRPAPPAPAEREVSLNGQGLSAEALRAFQQHHSTVLPDGRYWYDAASGAWGAEGGPTAGFLAPELEFPGPMPKGCSGSGTGLFANGRELHPREVVALTRALGTAPPGRYWLDALGNLGIEDGPFLMNLLAPSPPGVGAAGAGLLAALGAPPRAAGAALPPTAAAPTAVPLAGPDDPAMLRRAPPVPVWTTPFRVE